MRVLMEVLALSAGGIVGVNARYWMGVWVAGWASPRFPWATFVINVSGCFLIGLLTVVITRWLPPPHAPAKLMVLTGFLGGYTTFSTFAYESAVLWERKEFAGSVANLAGSVAAGFVAVMLGMALGRGLSPQAPDLPEDVPVSRAAEEVVQGGR
jgi:CrcB protein